MRGAMRKEAAGDMFARFTSRIDKLTSKLDLALKRTLKIG